jgi:hypothetical protein
MSLRAKLAAEDADHDYANQAAAAGVSLTGLSNRHREIGDGGPRPIVGERLDRGTVLGGDGVQSAVPPELAGPRLLFARARESARDGLAVRERVPMDDGELQMYRQAPPGYRYYWFNDSPGRISRALKAGYAHVTDPETGEHVNLMVNKRVGGGGMRGYLMMLPFKWYAQDQDRSQARLEERLSQIRAGRPAIGGENQYSPEGRTKFVSGVGRR